MTTILGSLVNYRPKNKDFPPEMCQFNTQFFISLSILLKFDIKTQIKRTKSSESFILLQKHTIAIIDRYFTKKKNVNIYKSIDATSVISLRKCNHFHVKICSISDSS